MHARVRSLTFSTYIKQRLWLQLVSGVNRAKKRLQCMVGVRAVRADVRRSFDRHFFLTQDINTIQK